jgi:hypothetical protein
MAEKLVAKVLGITDLGEVQLADARGPEEQIELEIQVQQGALCPGKRVRLSGPGFGEEIEFRSFEMLRKLDDPNWVRITCSKPKSQSIPTGELAGWTITEL